MRIGIHCPISGGYIKAVDYLQSAGGNTMQIFSGNPRGWARPDPSNITADEFYTLRKEKNIAPLVIHAPYLINLASPSTDIHEKSATSLAHELVISDKLKADYLVLHPGSYTTSSKEEGTEKIIKTLNEILNDINPKTELLLENTAGQGSSIGSDFDELLAMKKALNNRINFCIDTAHAFEAGYSIDEILNHKISDFIKVVHINDSKTPLGSHKDRHHHIGEGMIGIDNFKKLINHPAWKDKPFILETPWDEGYDKKNIALLKSLLT